MRLTRLFVVGALLGVALGAGAARASFIEPDGVCHAKGFVEYHGFGNGVWNIYMSGTGSCVTERDGLTPMSFFSSDNLYASRCPDRTNRMNLGTTVYFTGVAAEAHWNFLVTPGTLKGIPVSVFRARDAHGDEIGDGLVRSGFFGACLPDRAMPTNVYTRFPADIEFTTVY